MGKNGGDKLPRTVKALDQKRKKWAKKNGLNYKDGKGNKKLAKEEYQEAFLEGLDRSMEIILHQPNSKIADRVKDKIDAALARPKRMAEAAKIYPEHRKEYRNIIYLPNMIMTTIRYLQNGADKLEGKEKEIAASIDETALVDFCETILKKSMKHYTSYGLSRGAAFTLACLVPSAHILEKSYWYRALLTTLYDMAETDTFEIETIFEAVTTVDKSKVLHKRDMKRKFWLEFILMKNSNRFKNLNESQKNLHEHLQNQALEYLNGLSKDELEAMLYKYIKRRRESENNNSDGRRIFRFVDHANSNSPYGKIKQVVEKIISAKPDYEVYLK